MDQPQNNLRDYQHLAVTQLRARWQDRPILCIECGAGKTVIAADIIRRAELKRRRTVFLTHRRELVFQAVKRLAPLRVGMILSGEPLATDVLTYVASVQTLARRSKPPADLVIVDECQHATSPQFRDLLDFYDDIPRLGLSATPMRLDGQGLAPIFGCIVTPITTSELIAQGYLHEPVVFVPVEPDLSKVRTRAGDYAIDETFGRMQPIVGNIVEHWCQLAVGKRTLVFAVNVEHSKLIVDSFKACGISAEHLDATTDTAIRDATLDRLAMGSTLIVSNVGLFVEGVDVPAVECVVMARPTKSLALHRQAIGRAMRVCPGKAGAIILDCAGNTKRLGLISDPIEFSLDSKVKRPVNAQTWRVCRTCFAINPADALACSQCGAVFAVVAKPVEAVDGELVKYEPGERKKALNQALSGAFASGRESDVLRSLVQIGTERGYKPGWAAYRFSMRFKRWPSKEEIRSARNTPQAARPPP